MKRSPTYEELVKRVKELENKIAAYNLPPEHCKNIIASSIDVIWVADLSFRPVFASHSVKDLIGYYPEELQTLKVEQFLRPSSIKIIKNELKNYEKLLSEGKAGSNYSVRQELEFIHKNGNPVWGELLAYPILDENNKLKAIQGITRNIDQQKKVQKTILQTNANLRALLNSSDKAIYLLGKEREILQFNTKGKNCAVTLLNKPVKTGEDFIQYVREETKEEFLQDYNRALQGKHSKKERLLHENGEKQWFEINYTPVYDKNNEILGVYFNSKNISEEKKKTQEMITAKRKAEQSERLKTAFLENISHQIRTPLNAIMGFASLLSKKNIPDKKRKHFIHTIQDRGKHLLNIIGDIIDLSEIKAGMVSLQPEKINLNHLIKELELYYKTIINQLDKDRNIEIHSYRGFDDSEAAVFTDSTKLREILNNLLDNAVNFTQKGKIEFGYKLKTNDQLLFFVKDTGIGLSPEQQAVVFENFNKVDNSNIHEKAGTGIGLSIARELIQLFTGQIWLESSPNKGTTFYFTIPYNNSGEKQPDAAPVEMSIQPSYEDLRWALNQAAIVSVSDSNGNILFANKKFAEISGYAQKELIGKSHKILNSGYHPKSFFENMWNTLKNGQIWQGEIKNKTKTGKYFWVDTTIVPFINTEGKPFQYLSIRFDITKRKEAEKIIDNKRDSLQ